MEIKKILWYCGGFIVIMGASLFMVSQCDPEEAIETVLEPIFIAAAQSDAENDCKTITDWMEKCSGSPTPGRLAQCIHDVKDGQPRCLNPFLDLVMCIEEDSTCEHQNCIGELAAFCTYCGIPRGVH